MSFISRTRFVAAGLLALGLNLLLSSASMAQDEAKTSIHIVSQSWENYAEEDCKGYMWTLVKTVFAKQGYELKCTIAPYKRGVEMVKRGLADGWLASYKNEQKFALYPSWPHDYELTGVATTKSAMAKWNTNEGLSGKTVAYVRGYELDSYIDDDIKTVEVNTLKQGLDMVLAGRADFAADDSDDMEAFLEANSGYRKTISVQPLFKLALYLAFNDSLRSRTLIKVWDQHFPSLLEEGVIENIYTQAGKNEDFMKFWRSHSRPR